MERVIELSLPQEAITKSTAQRNLFLAGVGSGKSFTISLLSADYLIHNPEVIQFIGANTYSQLSKSTLKRVFDSWRVNYGWIEDLHFRVDKRPYTTWPKLHQGLKSYENTITFNNGALIYTASLDNYKVIDGTEFGIAFLDETKDTKEEAVKEVIVARLRQAGIWLTQDGELIKNKKEVEQLRKSGVNLTGFNPLYIFTSPAKVPWINEWFHIENDYEEIQSRIMSKDDFYMKRTEKQCVVISSTYHNEHNLAEGYIDNLLEDYMGKPNLVDMLIYGSPVAKSGSEFYHGYVRSKHVKPCNYNPNLPVHFSFDFNVQPYITAQVWQIDYIDGRYKARCIKILSLSAPKNNSEDLSKTLLSIYSDDREGCFIYGDASGANEANISKQFRHNYDVIKHHLRPMMHTNSYRVEGYNYPRVKRRDFVNKAFMGGFALDIEIDPSCKEFLMDLEFVKEDVDGGKKKEVVKDSLGNSYQKYGHHGDAFEYFLCRAFKQWFVRK